MSGNPIPFCPFCIKIKLIYIYFFFKPVLPTWKAHSLSSKNDLLQSGNAWDIYLNQVGPWADPTLAPRRWSLTRKVNAWAWVRRASSPRWYFACMVFTGWDPRSRRYATISFYTCLPPLKALGAATITGKLRRINIGIRINCKRN